MLEGYWYVYRATHKESGRSYVGLTNDFERRKKEHLKLARLGSPQYFHRAIRKYGADSFEWGVIARCSTLDAASYSEKLAIRDLDCYGGGFNMTTGGEARWTKVTREETKAKLAALYLGKTYEEIHGPEKALEIRQKMSIAVRKPWSPEARAKRSEANRRRWVIGNIGKKGRPVSVSGSKYRNMVEAAKAVGVSKCTIGNWAKSGKNQTAFL